MKMKTMLTSVKKFDHKIKTNKMLTRNTKICKLFVVQYVFVRSVTLHTFVSPNKQFLSFLHAHRKIFSECKCVNELDRNQIWIVITLFQFI